MMSPDSPAWAPAIEFVLSMEGGYENDPRDPGGETKYGISKKSFPNLDIAALTIEQAQAIYRKQYWEVMHCDELPPKISIAAFDCAVNQGVGRASRLLQICLDVVVDGYIGPFTIAAAHRATDETLALSYIYHRAEAYVDLIVKNNSLQIYAKNWMRRLVKLEALILRLPPLP